MILATTDFRLLTRRKFCARTLLALACSFVPSCIYLRRSSLYQPRIGALTMGSALIKARFEDEVPQLVLSQDSHAQNARSVSGQRRERSNIAEFHIDALQPGTEYFYGFSAQPGSSFEAAGRFRTLPVGAASFRFVFASCARTGSEHEVFRTILRRDPLFFLEVGDLHYRNINQNDRALFQQAYSEVFGSRVQGALYANVPLIYVWMTTTSAPTIATASPRVGLLPGSRIKNASLTTRWPSEQATYRYATLSVSGGCVSW